VRSAVITDGADRAPTRAMLKAAGFSDEDLRRPIIGVANTWSEIVMGGGRRVSTFPV